MRAIRLRTEYRKNPLGIDQLNPRFTWNCEDGERQCAYRVIVTDDERGVLFDSGKVETSSMHCQYKGNPLCSRQRAYWKVWIWDEKGQESASDTAWFEMGLLKEQDWKAKWIGGIDTDREERLAADCFRRKFTTEKTVVRARLYATACGVYAAWLNGKRVPGVLAPGCTEYEKRLYYQVYDVTDAIQKENCLEFMVGDGW